MLNLHKPDTLHDWVAVAPQGDHVRVVQVTCRPGQRPLLAWARTAAWGEAEASLRQLRRSCGLSGQRTVALLQRPQYQLLGVDAPEVPRAEWRDALRWQLKDLVDFPVDNAAIDVLEVPHDPAQRRRATVIAVAAAHAQLEPLATAGHNAKLPWHAIDVPETALRNVAALLEEEGRGLALLHVGARHSTLVITWQGELLQSRSIDVAYGQLTDADGDARQQAYERASLELQRSLDSVERQFSHVGLARLLVAPGAPLAEFSAYVRDLVYVPVAPFELADALELAAVPELTDPIEQAAYLPVIGAALRGP